MNPGGRMWMRQMIEQKSMQRVPQVIVKAVLLDYTAEMGIVKKNVAPFHSSDSTQILPP